MATYEPPPSIAQQHWLANYAVGNMVPSSGFGKVYVVEAGVEHEHSDGEVLTECLATHYELRSVKKSRSFADRRKTFLGFAQLQNDGAQAAQIDSAVGFEYVKETNWGSVEGVSRGLPVQVFEGSRPPVQLAWAVAKVENKTEVSVGNYLQKEGLASNIL